MFPFAPHRPPTLYRAQVLAHIHAVVDAKYEEFCATNDRSFARARARWQKVRGAIMMGLFKQMYAACGVGTTRTPCSVALHSGRTTPTFAFTRFRTLLSRNPLQISGK